MPAPYSVLWAGEGSRHDSELIELIEGWDGGADWSVTVVSQSAGVPADLSPYDVLVLSSSYLGKSTLDPAWATQTIPTLLLDPYSLEAANLATSGPARRDWSNRAYPATTSSLSNYLAWAPVTAGDTGALPQTLSLGGETVSTAQSALDSDVVVIGFTDPAQTVATVGLVPNNRALLNGYTNVERVAFLNQLMAANAPTVRWTFDGLALIRGLFLWLLNEVPSFPSIPRTAGRVNVPSWSADGIGYDHAVSVPTQALSATMRTAAGSYGFTIGPRVRILDAATRGVLASTDPADGSVERIWCEPPEVAYARTRRPRRSGTVRMAFDPASELGRQVGVGRLTDRYLVEVSAVVTSRSESATWTVLTGRAVERSRLVETHGQVLVTLGLEGQVSALDAAIDTYVPPSWLTAGAGVRTDLWAQVVDVIRQFVPGARIATSLVENVTGASAAMTAFDTRYGRTDDLTLLDVLGQAASAGDFVTELLASVGAELYETGGGVLVARPVRRRHGRALVDFGDTGVPVASVELTPAEFEVPNGVEVQVQTADGDGSTVTVWDRDAASPSRVWLNDVSRGRWGVRKFDAANTFVDTAERAQLVAGAVLYDDGAGVDRVSIETVPVPALLAAADDAVFTVTHAESGVSGCFTVESIDMQVTGASMTVYGRRCWDPWSSELDATDMGGL